MSSLLIHSIMFQVAYENKGTHLLFPFFFCLLNKHMKSSKLKARARHVYFKALQQPRNRH
uniref:Uncharacterized protein n=1 Tax=Anguilla anguilla TaxID=7936 RepID=A0A0E9RTL4_ANGAN